MSKRIVTSIFALAVVLTAYSQENGERSLLANHTTVVKFSPAPDLSPVEIEKKVNAINPYTLYRKGSVAEYAFEQGGKQTKFMEGPSYVQQYVADERIENGLLVAYVQQRFLNKKHQPSKGIPENFKSYYYPTEIDTAGTYHLTHDYYRAHVILSKRKGYAMLVPFDLKVGDDLTCSTISDVVKGGIGNTMKYSTAYSDFKVVAEEKLTTPAGTLDCLKLTGRIKEKMTGVGGFECNNYCQWWIARGVGIVRYEIYEDTEKGRSKAPFVMYLNSLELK